MKPPIDVVLLAGGKGVRLRKATKDTPKPLIKINGVTMLEKVTRTLLASNMIGKIVLVMDLDLVPEELKKYYYVIIPPIGEINTSIERGLMPLDNPERALIITADIPFMSIGGLHHFITRCLEIEPELAMPAVTKETSETMFPGGKRHYAHLPEGTFTLGNLCWIAPRKLNDNAYALIGLAAGRRKSKTRLVGLLGWKAFLQYITGKISIASIESTISQKIGLKTKVIFSSDPGVAFDIDTPEHLEYVTNLHR